LNTPNGKFFTIQSPMAAIASAGGSRQYVGQGESTSTRLKPLLSSCRPNAVTIACFAFRTAGGLSIVTRVM
jgi:hypothetical protein